jgi:Tol biopolymer transport system component
MDKDGNYPFNYTRNSAGDFGATWDPGGEHLAFTRAVPSQNGSSDYEVHEMGLAGTYQTNLSRSVAMEDHPSYAPDAKQIAFTTNRDGNEEIYVMNGLASSPKNLTNNATDDFDPDWAKASS